MNCSEFQQKTAIQMSVSDCLRRRNYSADGSSIPEDGLIAEVSLDEKI